MPQVPISEGNRVRREPLPGARIQPVDATGGMGAIGESLTGLGQAGQRAVEIEAEVQNQAERARLTADYFGSVERINHARLGFRESLADGATGYTGQVRETIAGEESRFLEQIRNPEMRSEFATRFAQFRTSTLDEDETFAFTQRLRSIDTNQDLALGIAVNGITNDPNATVASLFAAREPLHALVHNESGLPQSVRNARLERIDALTAEGFLVGTTRRNPNATIALIESGAFDSDLPPERLRALYNNAQSEIAAEQARTRAARVEMRQEVTVRAQNIDRRIRDGEIVPDDELAALQRDAAASGLSNEVYDIGNYRVRMQVTRRFGPQSGQTSEQIRAELDRVDARIGAAGEGASTQDRIARDQLNALLDVATRQQQSDPYRGYTQRGGRLAALDTANPRSIDARVEAMHGAGTTQFFTPQELPGMRELYASGPAGRLEVANRVANIAARDVRAGEYASAQVASNDRAFRQAVRIPAPHVRGRILSGAAARQQLPQMTRPDGSNASFDTISQEWFQAHIAPMLRSMPQEYQNDVLEAGRSHYAAMARDAGNLAIPRVDLGTLAESVSAVLGQTSAGGGTGYWNYGPRRGRVGVVLPERMTQQRFDQVMTWLPIARLGERFPPDAAPRGPAVWPNRNSVSVDDIRGRFVPRMVDDGVYEFFSDSGAPLRVADGRPFRLDVYALAARPPARASAPAPRLTAEQQRQLDAIRNAPRDAAAARAAERRRASEVEWGD